MRSLSRLLTDIPSSPITAMVQKGREMARTGIDVVNLASGEPDFDTPLHIQETAYKAIREGDTHYPPSYGTPELLEAIAAKLKRENGVHTAPDNIIATPGGKWALYVALMTVINPGDEVLILDPAWVSYKPMVQIVGGTPVPLSLRADKGFALDRELLEAHITPRTRMIIVNSPNNPTGCVMTPASIRAVVDAVVEHDIYLLSDEIYEHIIYPGHEHISPASYPEMAERTFIVNGFSKAYAMTGWRLGWLMGPPEAIRLGRSYMTNSVTSAASFTMAAGVAALDGPQQCVADMLEVYARRRRFLLDAFDEIEGIECFPPEGAFYLFMRFPRTRRNSVALASYLLDEAHVAATPGAAFGAAGEGHLRISFASHDDELEKFVERLAKLAPAF